MTGLPPWGVGLLVGGVCAALLWWRLSRSDEPGSLALRWGATVVLAAGMILLAARFLGAGSTGNRVGDFGVALIVAGGVAAGGIVMGLIWGRHLGELVARPFTSLFDGGGRELPPAPLYSTAIAHRKQRRIPEALAELRRQLEKFPGDFEGTLMLAELQAEDVQDLPAAEATLRAWIREAPRDRGQQAVALTRLAHWHLHQAHDVERARGCLEEIVQTFPGTEAALLAEQRLAHLEFEAQPKSGPLVLREGIGAPIDTGVPPPPPTSDETAEMAALVRQLALHPHDVAARERLAWLYGWHCQRPDLARLEFETLLGLPNASSREVAHWLNQVADLEIQVARDPEAARRALERLIARYPNSAAAEQARNRLPFLRRELARHAPIRVLGQH